MSSNNTFLSVLFTEGPLDNLGVQGALLYYSTETCVEGDGLRHYVSSGSVQKRITFLPPPLLLPPLSVRVDSK